MRKKLWKIIPLLTGLVLLTAGSALTVHGESDNTIDVTLFKLHLPDDWSYDPNDISDYENSCSVSVQILLERYAYSEIGGTFILIWRYAFSTQNGTFFLYYCDVTIIHHSAKEELLCTPTILFLES